MMFKAIGLSSRVGMLSQRRVPPVTIVLLSNSSGVSKAATVALTVGRLPGAIAVKFPPRMRDVGTWDDRNCTTFTSQRRSYESRKNVLWPNFGRGPEREPPTSLRLNLDLGNSAVSAVGRKSACAFLSCTVQAASASFLLL